MNMSEWLQHLLVFTAVGLSGGFVLWQTLRTLRGRGGSMGSCCAKGCQPTETSQSKGSRRDRIVFMPLEMLSRKR